jgi:SAM-dependent methyltransferase
LIKNPRRRFSPAIQVRRYRTIDLFPPQPHLGRQESETTAMVQKTPILAVPSQDKACAHGQAPSPWVAAAIEDLQGPSAKRRVLDLACGGGRHARLLVEAGHRVLAVDRDVAAISARGVHPKLEILAFNLENKRPWPFAAERFKGVVVTNYLYRPMLRATLDLVAPGGILIYETFGVGNARLGRPSNPDFLARPGEIAAMARASGFSISNDSHGRIDLPRAAIVQRVIARKNAI